MLPAVNDALVICF